MNFATMISRRLSSLQARARLTKDINTFNEAELIQVVDTIAQGVQVYDYDVDIENQDTRNEGQGTMYLILRPIAFARILSHSITNFTLSKRWSKQESRESDAPNEE
jgi:hypothetical protein